MSDQKDFYIAPPWLPDTHPSEADRSLYCRAVASNTVALRYGALLDLKQVQMNCLSFGFESKVSFRYDLLKL